MQSETWVGGCMSDGGSGRWKPDDHNTNQGLSPGRHHQLAPHSKGSGT
jgi:hypothetical protein